MRAAIAPLWLVAVLIGGPALAIPSAAPVAIAVIEVAVTGARCSLTSPDGSRSEVPCSASGWTPAVEPGGSAQMTATIGYHYSDDGQPLALNGLGPPAYSFQLDSRGFSNLYPEYESAAIYLSTSYSRCLMPFSVCGSTYDVYSGDTDFPPAFVSSNAFAEDVSGELSATVGMRWDPPAAFYGQGFAFRPTLYIGANARAFSVAAIPEPAVWTLMIAPLLGLGWLSRRRQCSSRS